MNKYFEIELSKINFFQDNIILIKNREIVYCSTLIVEAMQDNFIGYVLPIVDWQGLIIDLEFSSNYSDAQKVEVNWKSKINNFMNLDCHPTSHLTLNSFKENLSEKEKMAREWTDEDMVKHTLYLLVCLMVTARNDLKFTKEVCSSFLKEGQKQTYILRDFVRAIELVSTLKLSNKTPKRNKYHQFLKKMVLGDPSYVSYFKGFICDKTVTELEISGENIYSCCPSYFPLPVGTVEDALNDKGFLSYNLNQNYSNIVNSTTKKESKFQFCSMIDCPKIKNLEHGPKVDLNQAKPKLSEVRLSFDATCNLWCAYCRGGKIVANKAKQDEHQALYKTLIKELLLRTDRVFLNGYGDVFASKICRQMLHDIKVETHPNLKVDIITNGILFNERAWKDFESCNYAFSKIRISIDAASEMTYKVNRLGGTWSILMKNLKFISALRKNNLIDDFSISMVVQENNYSEMCEFYNLGVNLGCDYVIFEELMDWNVLDKEIISKMIISNSNHPGFNDFKKEKTKLSNLVTETEVGKSFGEFPILSHSWSI